MQECNAGTRIGRGLPKVYKHNLVLLHFTLWTSVLQPLQVLDQEMFVPVPCSWMHNMMRILAFLVWLLCLVFMFIVFLKDFHCLFVCFFCFWDGLDWMFCGPLEQLDCLFLSRNEWIQWDQDFSPPTVLQYVFKTVTVYQNAVFLTACLNCLACHWCESLTRIWKHVAKI